MFELIISLFAFFIEDFYEQNKQKIKFVLFLININ
jgi:hypothetical protein